MEIYVIDLCIIQVEMILQALEYETGMSAAIFFDPWCMRIYVLVYLIVSITGYYYDFLGCKVESR